jgi:UDP-glucuronate 4-epimerase
MNHSDKLLVTGAAGFIGFHVAERLLRDGLDVAGLDNLNDYYDVALKADRLARLTAFPNFRFVNLDLADRAGMARLFAEGQFARVIHLAAQAGVRYSLENPAAYVDSNLVGFAEVLEGCRRNGCEHLLYASSSSVYGANTTLPFATDQNVDHPLSLYAATKKANELMAHTYAHLYRLPTTGLRFFTVYGPWGRPDMAMWIFADRIFRGEPISLFNQGHMRRDFTFVSDVVEAVVRLAGRPAKPDPTWSGESPAPNSSNAPWRLYNIGNHSPVEVEYVVKLIERETGRTARREYLPMQPGDVPATYADVGGSAEVVDFAPRTSIEVGVRSFVAWLRGYKGF